ANQDVTGSMSSWFAIFLKLRGRLKGASGRFCPFFLCLFPALLLLVRLLLLVCLLGPWPGVVGKANTVGEHELDLRAGLVEGAVHNHQVSGLAWSNSAKLVFHPQDVGRIHGQRSQGRVG